MLAVALIAFAVAAAGGLVLATHVFNRRLAPWAISILHALLGAAGLVLLLLAVLAGSSTAPTIAALVLFAVAALGGFVLAAFHLRRALPPRSAVVVHAAVAVVAFGVLLSAIVVA